MAGRPTKLTSEVRKKLEEAAALDCTIEETCLYAGISKPTYYEWTKADPALSDRLDELRQTPVLKARQTVVKKLTENYGNAMDYLARKRKGEFAPRQELTGENGQPLFDHDQKEKGKAAIGAFRRGHS